MTGADVPPLLGAEPLASRALLCHGGGMAEVGTVAVLSDVHGVLPVLDAVLATTEVRAAELVVVTGDHCSGPQPREVLDALPHPVELSVRASRTARL